MRAAALALALVACAAAIGCSGTKAPETRDEPVIGIRCKVARAVIVINDRELGTVRSLRAGIRLSPGKHRLMVRHPDYHTYYELLDLSRRERRVIEVELAEKLH